MENMNLNGPAGESPDATLVVQTAYEAIERINPERRKTGTVIRATSRDFHSNTGTGIFDSSGVLNA
jgi:hypothetical protein